MYLKLVNLYEFDGFSDDPIRLSTMKLDTSGLETTMPMIGFGSNGEMLDGFSSVPSFDLPRTTDVSFSHRNSTSFLDSSTQRVF